MGTEDVTGSGTRRALDDVEFLARSDSRVAVLDLVRTAPRSRDDLKEATAVSRVTLSRILREFEERGWLARRDGEYEATPRGAFVAAEFTRLLDDVEAANDLDGALRWLPTEAFGFPLGCIADAEIVTPSRSDHTAAIRRVSAAVDRAEWVHGTATGVSREVIDALRDLTVERGGSLRMVLGPEAVEVIRTDAGLRHRFHEVLDAGDAAIARYAGDRPVLMVLLTDQEVLLCGHDEDGPPPGTVVTADETVRGWAAAYFESRRAESAPLDPATFTP